jgi:hypothetical protein
MIEFNSKRRKIITSYCCVSFFSTVVWGCTPASPVTIYRILQAVKLLRQFLDITQKTSKTTAANLNFSYQDLGKDLRTRNFSTETISKMEKRHLYLATSARKLTSFKNKTKDAAKDLFSLLETRANQNSTPELKEKMLPDIRDKKQIFEDKIKIVEEALSEIDKSIKKYDDILGYMQVLSGTKDIQQYIDNVDKAIAQADVLNKEVQTALDEGDKIINQFETIK